MSIKRARVDSQRSPLEEFQKKLKYYCSSATKLQSHPNKVPLIPTPKVSQPKSQKSVIFARFSTMYFQSNGLGHHEYQNVGTSTGRSSSPDAELK